MLDKKKSNAPSEFRNAPETQQDQYYGAPILGGGPLAIGYYNTPAAPAYGYGQPNYGYDVNAAASGGFMGQQPQQQNPGGFW